MASFAFVDAGLTVNSVDLSDFLTSVTLNVEADDLEDTAFGDTYRSRIGGLKSYSLDVEFNQDFAASAPDVSLFSLIGTVVTFALKPVAASAISTTNPEYQGSVLITEYTPLDGGVGDLAKTSASWPGSGALTRDVTP